MKSSRLTQESRAFHPASVALGADADRLAPDQVRRVLEASAGVVRMSQSRPLFMGILMGSVALHLCTLLILDLLERAPPIKPDTALEIPIELVSDADAKKGEKGNKAETGGKEGVKGAQGLAGQPGQKTEDKAEDKPESEPKATPAEQSEIKPPSQAAAKPPQAPEKTAEAKPPASEPKPPEPAKPEPAPKAAATQVEPPKPVATQPEPPKPVMAQTEPPKPAPPPPQPVAAPTAPPAPPPQSATAQAPPAAMAALQPQPPRSASAPSPFGLMSDSFQAVAVPTPSADGDEDMSYKTIVFGMMELAKQFPDDARARGAHGTARIQFELNDDGTVKNVSLLQSSGDASLDVESLAVVERAAPYPKPPPGAQKAFAAVIEFDNDEAPAASGQSAPSTSAQSASRAPAQSVATTSAQPAPAAPTESAR